MIKRSFLPLAAIIIAAGCSTVAVTPKASAPAANRAPAASTAPKVTPASELVDHSGDSVETAVTVPADAPEDGLAFENNWMFDHFGKFRRLGGGTGVLNGRRYDVIDIEVPSGEKHKVFFDITENWKTWEAPQTKPES